MGTMGRFSVEVAPKKDVPVPEVVKEVKETYIQRSKRFWNVLISDYKDSVRETIKDVKAKPKKTSVYLGTMYAGATNPNEKSYLEVVLESADEMILISDSNRNRSVENRLKFIHSCYNEGLIRHLSLGMFSFIWLDNFHNDCALYPSQCYYIQPGFLDFHTRVIDVGFLGRWWNIQNAM